MNIEGKTAVVTGGASGIGAALVRAITARQCTVIIADYEKEKAELLAKELGPKASAIGFDAADTGSVEEMASKAWAQTGGVDLVFANAGINLTGPLLQATPEQFDWIFGVNVRGVWATCQAFANRMIANGRQGHLTITASEHSIGLQHTGAGFYTSTKHALLGLAEVFRGELPENVGISVLCPGLTATDLYDADRFGVLAPGNEAAKSFGAQIMSKGMKPSDIAEHTLEGVSQGNFYIVTHAVSFPPAEKRFEEIKAAFKAQAPMTTEAKQYEVNKVVASVLADLEEK